MIRSGSGHRARRTCRSIVNFSKALAASDSASRRVIYECGDLRWIWWPSWTSHRKRCSSRGSDSISTVKCGSSLAAKCGSSAMFALCRDQGHSAMAKKSRPHSNWPTSNANLCRGASRLVADAKTVWLIGGRARRDLTRLTPRQRPFRPSHNCAANSLHYLIG